VILFLTMTFSGATRAQQTKTMNTKTDKTENQSLTAREKGIATIAALTAKGDLEKLQTALNEGLDAKLTVNEIKEVLVQMYAYAGFPRSLNGIGTFMKALEERKKKGIADAEGKTAAPIDDAGDKYERGRKTLETLTGQSQSKPAKGFGEFSPAIDRFLKEHLFADIFDSDVLSFQQRELATISALAAMPGVEPQLESHLAMGMNTGLTESQLSEAFDLIEKNISQSQAETARKSLIKVMAARPEKVGAKDMKLKITVGEKILTARLYDNATTRELISRLPLTLPMKDLYEREVVYNFPEALPVDEEKRGGYEVGDISYWSPWRSFVIFYKQNGEIINLQKIGHIDSGVEIFETTGDTEVSFEFLKE
jgi:4-carboxymuconolactone decarboxylase